MLKVYLYLALLVIMSLISLICFAVDKKNSSKEGRDRMPEIVLLTLTTFGGSIGAFIGMYVLRHKTNPVTKFHFAITTWLSLAVQAGLGVLLFLFC
jgi:uncharacterized membrane protein YsdA (DUF1294 family)